MLKHTMLYIGFLLLVYTAEGQQKNNKTAPLAFSSINQVGLLTGQTGQAAALQTINGITIKNWFAGIGVGLDYYGSRGIPLFADVRKDLSNKKNSPFVYVDGGLHFPWETDAELSNKGFERSGKSGGYFDAGLGFKVRTKGNNALLFSAGYSYKKVTNKSQIFSIWPWPSPAPTYEYYQNEYRRIVVKMGIQL